jgi:hypothetical protein
MLKILSVFDPRIAVSGEVDSIGHIAVRLPNFVEDINVGHGVATFARITNER